MIKKPVALLIVDLQKDFLSPEGKLAEAGQDLSMMQATIGPIKKIITFARQQSLPIIFTQMIDGLKYRNEVGQYRFSKKEKNMENICALEGTDGADFYEIFPKAQDKVIIKHNYCSFHQTELDAYLREKGIKTLIVVGVKTNACVETTIRTAYHKGYFVIVPRECVASDDQQAHLQSLKSIERYFGDVVKLEKLLNNQDLI
jgi:ureidoacrylate peracid hydrolase